MVSPNFACFIIWYLYLFVLLLCFSLCILSNLVSTYVFFCYFTFLFNVFSNCTTVWLSSRTPFIQDASSPAMTPHNKGPTLPRLTEDIAILWRSATVETDERWRAVRFCLSPGGKQRNDTRGLVFYLPRQRSLSLTYYSQGAVLGFFDREIRSPDCVAELRCSVNRCRLIMNVAIKGTAVAVCTIQIWVSPQSRLIIW